MKDSGMRERLRRIVSAAIRAPSAENCQPFTFRWNGQALLVRHDPERARHRLNLQNHLSLLGLGTLLESLALAASTEGLRLEDSLGLDDLRTAVWATARFQKGSGADRLAQALAVRQTDRRLYLGGSLQAPVFAELRREVERFPECGLYVSPRPEGELLAFCLEAESFLWRDPAVYRDVMRWIRFSKEELQRTGDGFAWRSLGPPLPSIPGVRLVRDERVRHTLYRTHLYRASALWLRAQLASSAGLICITTRSPSPRALVAAGRLGLAVWLHLNLAGYGVQPLSLQSTPIHSLAIDPLLSADFPPGLSDFYARGQGLLRRAFGFSSPELPVWLFRTGRAFQHPFSPGTPRLPVERVLEFAED